MRAAIVLAAGRSRRFGRADKLFAPFLGAPLLLHALRAARAAPVTRVVVVAGNAARVRAMVRRDRLSGVHVVRLGDSRAPLAASLRAAIAALRPVERDAFVFLGDMPAASARDARRLARKLSPGVRIARPRYRGMPGHPVLARGVRARPLGEGEAGFRAGRGKVGWIEGGPGCIVDVDSRAALARARRLRIRV